MLIASSHRYTVQTFKPALSLLVRLKFDSSVDAEAAELRMPVFPVIASALMLVGDANGLGGVRVELETDFLHLQPQQVHLSVSGKVRTTPYAGCDITL